MKNIFERPEESYNITFDDETYTSIMNDKNSPIRVISNIIEDGKKVLDVGSGNGILGFVLLKSGRNITIDACEPSSYACGISHEYYRNIYCDFFQNIKTQLSKENYDYIVLADVIEHISNPQSFLNDCKMIMGDNTKILIDIPNVAHYSTRFDLLKGKFDYTDSGLLERTHIRFFSQKTILEMFGKLDDLYINEIYYIENIIERQKGISTCIEFIFSFLLVDKPRVFQYLLVCSNKTSPTKYNTLKVKLNIKKRILKKLKII